MWSNVVLVWMADLSTSLGIVSGPAAFPFRRDFMAFLFLPSFGAQFHR